MNISVEISPGELYDKISILEIKAERVQDPQRLGRVRHELALLVAARDRAVGDPPAALAPLYAALKRVNERLWEIEDDIRACERGQDFGPAFVALARAVYRTNDERARLKNEISALFASQLVEVKSYAPY
jgi:hypothetical protein